MATSPGNLKLIFTDQNNKPVLYAGFVIWIGPPGTAQPSATYSAKDVLQTVSGGTGGNPNGVAWVNLPQSWWTQPLLIGWWYQLTPTSPPESQGTYVVSATYDQLEVGSASMALGVVAIAHYSDGKKPAANIVQMIHDSLWNLLGEI
jgi:hypothetical protein